LNKHEVAGINGDSLQMQLSICLSLEVGPLPVCTTKMGKPCFYMLNLTHRLAGPFMESSSDTGARNC